MSTAAGSLEAGHVAGLIKSIVWIVITHCGRAWQVMSITSLAKLLEELNRGLHGSITVQYSLSIRGTLVKFKRTC